MFFRGMILVLNRFYDMFVALLFVAFLFAGRCIVGTSARVTSGSVCYFFPTLDVGLSPIFNHDSNKLA